MDIVRWLVPGLVLAMLGCGPDTDVGTAADIGTEAAPTTDAELEATHWETVVFPDTVGTETTADYVFGDWRAGEHVAPRVECEPGAGCFLDPCSKNGECQSSWCVEHMGQKVCTWTCEEECPAGWTCSPVEATKPDVVFICVSDFTNLCRPCNDAADCAGAAGTDDACVLYGDQGAFCGGKCAEGGQCPWGFQCESVTTVDGIELDQCVADTGLCPCTDTAVELGLFTNCSATNEFGTCVGKRVCTEAGLTDCDAPEPAEEICDGVDNDCDGDVDEPAEVGGNYVNLCDDGNGCTLDTCNGEDGCHQESLTEGECLDGDPCTVADHCADGACVGNPVICDDKNPCTNDVCDGAGGCQFVDNTADCDDGDPCTVADQCADGQCAGVDVSCQCQTDEDCLAYEDGDTCNGMMFCDLDAWPYECEVDPSTVVECPSPEPGPDAICLAPSCDSASGQCSFVPDHEDFACEDGDACTIGDKCVEGTCAPGVDRNCNDGNDCTDDACDPDSGCTYTDNALPCDDGNVCTAGDSCVAGECVAGEPLVCDDGNVCNGLETCALGFGCKPGETLVCDDDDDVCTDSVCNPAEGCVTTLNEAPCDDNDLCTTGDHCTLGMCGSNDQLVCDDANVCTDDSCNPATGCVFLPNTDNCQDGTACTTGEHCSGGWCVSGGILDCNDGDLCTDDSCNPGSGCIHTPNNVSCDDDNECTTVDVCGDGGCAGIDTSAADCDDGNQCTADTCEPETGCVNTPLADGTDCGAGDSDWCQQGQCVLKAYCGDGILNGDEECDDGNEVAGDGCENDCALSPTGFTEFIEPGPHVFTVPEGVHKVKALAIGGGGSGNRCGGCTGGGGGGGASSLVDVFPGQKISLVVGRGGGNTGTDSVHLDGGNSSVGAPVNILAGGGKHDGSPGVGSGGSLHNSQGGTSGPENGVNAFKLNGLPEESGDAGGAGAGLQGFTQPYAGDGIGYGGGGGGQNCEHYGGPCEAGNGGANGYPGGEMYGDGGGPSGGKTGNADDNTWFWDNCSPHSYYNGGGGGSFGGGGGNDGSGQGDKACALGLYLGGDGAHGYVRFEWGP